MIQLKSFQLRPRWGHEVIANYIEYWFQFLWFDIIWVKPVADNVIPLRSFRKEK